jgi:hypothetical protein
MRILSLFLLSISFHLPIFAQNHMRELSLKIDLGTKQKLEVALSPTRILPLDRAVIVLLNPAACVGCNTTMVNLHADLARLDPRIPLVYVFPATRSSISDHILKELAAPKNTLRVISDELFTLLNPHKPYSAFFLYDKNEQEQLVYDTREYSSKILEKKLLSTFSKFVLRDSVAVKDSPDFPIIFPGIIKTNQDKFFVYDAISTHLTTYKKTTGEFVNVFSISDLLYDSVRQSQPFLEKDQAKRKALDSLFIQVKLKKIRVHNFFITSNGLKVFFSLNYPLKRNDTLFTYSKNFIAEGTANLGVQKISSQFPDDDSNFLNFGMQSHILRNDTLWGLNVYPEVNQIELVGITQQAGKLSVNKKGKPVNQIDFFLDTQKSRGFGYLILANEANKFYMCYRFFPFFHDLEKGVVYQIQLPPIDEEAKSVKHSFPTVTKVLIYHFEALSENKFAFIYKYGNRVYYQVQNRDTSVESQIWIRPKVYGAGQEVLSIEKRDQANYTFITQDGAQNLFLQFLQLK